MVIVFATEAFLTSKTIMSFQEAEQQEPLMIHLSSQALLSEYHPRHFPCLGLEMFGLVEEVNFGCDDGGWEVRAAVEAGLGAYKDLKRQQAATRRSLLTIKISLPWSRLRLGRTASRCLNNHKSTF